MQAGEVMTSGVATVCEDAPISDVIAIMEDRHVKRVPVMRDGRVVGIVSRADLIRTFLGATRPEGAREPAASAEVSR